MKQWIDFIWFWNQFAADDAAGSAIASKMDSQVGSLGVAIRNSYDAISMTQTAEGALGEVENMLKS